jgi:hypothetical protein
VGTPFLKVKILVLQYLRDLAVLRVGQQACLVLAVLLKYNPALVAAAQNQVADLGNKGRCCS